MKDLIRLLSVNSIIFISVVIIFDVLMFHLVSPYHTTRFKEYRADPAPLAGGIGGFPPGYYVKDNEKGFDIGVQKEGVHWVSGTSYPIWSNSYGCFDQEHENVQDYIYFAGDSHTWGYAPFEKKFATILDQKSRLSIFKCGVSHTGQLHQFKKLNEVVEKVGIEPKAIFVSYVVNDVANDYAYPHSTVIKGNLIDTTVLNQDDVLIQRSRKDLEEKVNSQIKKMDDAFNEKKQRSKTLNTIKIKLKFYSLTINILNYLKYKVSKSSDVDEGQVERPTYRSINKIKREKNNQYWYTDNPYAEKNKNAILAFKGYAQARGIDLIFVLVPDAVTVGEGNKDWYKELIKYLVLNNIIYVDLTSKFIEKGLGANDLSWPLDPHYSISGNKYTADVLFDVFPQYFRNEY